MEEREKEKKGAPHILISKRLIDLWPHSSPHARTHARCGDDPSRLGFFATDDEGVFCSSPAKVLTGLEQMGRERKRTHKMMTNSFRDDAWYTFFVYHAFPETHLYVSRRVP